MAPALRQCECERRGLRAWAPRLLRRQRAAPHPSSTAQAIVGCFSFIIVNIVVFVVVVAAAAAHAWRGEKSGEARPVAE